MPLNLRQPNKATKVDQGFEGTISVNPVMLGNNKTDYPSINSAIMRRNRLHKADADMMDLMGEQTFAPETQHRVAQQQQPITQTPNRDDVFHARNRQLPDSWTKRSAATPCPTFSTSGQ